MTGLVPVGECPHPRNAWVADDVWGADMYPEGMLCITCTACGGSFDMRMGPKLRARLLPAGGGPLHGADSDMSSSPLAYGV